MLWVYGRGRETDAIVPYHRLERVGQCTLKSKPYTLNLHQKLEKPVIAAHGYPKKGDSHVHLQESRAITEQPQNGAGKGHMQALAVACKFDGCC